MSKSPVALLLAFAGAAHAGEFKAAYVDLQRAVVEVDEGRAAKQRLQALAEQKESELKKERDGLQKEKDAFDKQASALAEDARRKREEELQKKVMEFAQRADKGRQELGELERKELSTIFGRLKPLLEQIATRDGFTMVFDSNGSGLAWAPQSLDVTNELIRLYNNTYKGPERKDAPKAAPPPKAAPAPKK